MPDTLDGWPLQNRDPLFLEEMPHVFFVGNQSRTSATWMTHPNGSRTRLLTIPSFDRTRSVTLLNLKNNELEASNYDFSDAFEPKI